MDQQMKMIFEDVEGFPVPRLPRAVDGTLREPDGKRLFDVEGAAARFNSTIAAMTALWVSYFVDLPKASEAVLLTDDPQAAADLAALVVDGDKVSAPAPGSRLDLLHRQRYPQLDGEQFLLFVETCRELSFSPFSGRLEPVLEHDNKSGRPVLRIITTIDAMSELAFRTLKYKALRGPTFCNERGEWRDVWLEKEPPAAATATVVRDGCEPFSATARWDAYAPFTFGPRGEKIYDPFWLRMPAEMLGKCAIVKALRLTFPEILGKLYTRDEMAQAANPRPRPPGGGQPSFNMSGGWSDEQGAPVYEDAVPFANRPAAAAAVPAVRFPNPSCEMQFHLSLQELNFDSAQQRQTVIEHFKTTMPREHRDARLAWYAAVLRAVSKNPPKFGATAM